jgi:hypothetical protein
VPGGYRFGHPAIAKPIFDALTSVLARNVSLEVRLARTLSLALKKMIASHRRRALRQIAPRLARDADFTPVDVLVLLYQSAGGPVLAADIAMTLLGSFGPNVAGQLKWVNAARTFRDNNSIDPKIRAQFAISLAVREPAYDQDVGAALRLTEHSEIGTHMGSMIWPLLNRKKGKVSPRLLPYAIKWAKRSANEKGWLRVIEALLSNYPNDRRVRQVALRLIATANVKSLRLPIVVALAKHMEQESEKLIKRWMQLHKATSEAGHVLNNLLARPGSTWVDTAIEWLGPSANPETGWIMIAAQVLRRVDPDHPFVLKAKEWVTIVEQLESSSPLFEAFGERARELDAIDIVEGRLRLRWGTRDAVRVFTKLWKHLPTLTDSMQQRIQDIVTWAELVPKDTSSRPIHSD